MADRNLTVHIIGDSRSLERAFTKSGRAATTFQGTLLGVNSSLGRIGKAAGVSLGLAAVFDQMRRSAQAASNLNEQINKSEVVFGSSASAIKAWSETTANAFGISQRAALEAAAGFGQILETAGLNQTRAAQLSKSLVELSADLASFNNIDPAEALDKLRSGLAGEAEPLRRVGVLLSETRVKQEAYASGIAKAGAKLTEQQKVIARYNLILKDTKTAQGDFARTSESLANKQRILSARIEELQARLGEDLVPVLSAVIDKLLAGEDAARRFAAALDKLPGGTSFKLKDLFGSGIKKEDIEELKRQSQLLDAAARGGATDQRLEQPADTKERRRRTAPVSLRNRFFDERVARRVDRVQDIKNLQGQVSELRKIEVLIQDRIKSTKDITRKLNLEDDLLGVRRQKRSVLDAIRDQTEQAKDRQRALVEQRKALERERKEQALERRERAAAVRERRQFLQLGLAADGSERVAGLGALRRRLGTLREQVKGTLLDTSKTRNQFDNIAKVLAEGPRKVGRDVRSAIQQMFADINDALKDGDDKLTKGRAVSSNSILSGLGLDRDTFKILQQRLSRIGANGKVLAGAGRGTPSAFGMALAPGGTSVLQGNVFLDGQKVGVVVTRPVTNQQQKRKRRQSSQTTGPFAGQ